MGTRELIILILGLAVLAVILRGLMVAMKARRGQLKMAIDKNIPKDVDLDALELAELPNGGARVVARSLEHVNRQNLKNTRTARTLKQGEARAQTLDLGGQAARAGAIPVLMDSVAVARAQPSAPEPQQQPEPQRQIVQPAPIVAARDDFDDFEEEDDLADDLDEDLDDEFGDDADIDEFEDDLVDIDDDDEEEDDEEFDPFKDDDLEDDEELEDEDEDDDDFDDFDEDEDEDDDEVFPKDDYFDGDDDFDYNKAAAAQRKTPTLSNEQSFEDSLGDFSMSAGERIGADIPAPRETPKAAAVTQKPARVAQPSLFDDQGAEAEPEVVKDKKPSLLERFGDRASAATATAQRAYTAKPVAPRRQEPRSPQKPADTTDFKAAKQAREQRSEAPRTIEPSEVLVINVMAREGQVFHGDDLLQTLITTGLKFGDMNIFHHRLNNRSDGAVIFSVANILNPGTFDLNRMGEFTTRGVSLFMAMPTVISNLEALELMLKTAQQIKGALNGELKDDHRNVMTAQTIEHYRQRVRDYELRRLKAAQA